MIPITILPSQHQVTLPCFYGTFLLSEILGYGFLFVGRGWERIRRDGWEVVIGRELRKGGLPGELRGGEGGMDDAQGTDSISTPLVSYFPFGA